jgi:hypothetical protein
MRLRLHQCGYAPEPARHGTARHGTARHGTARLKPATVPMAAVVLPWYCELPQLYIVSVVLIVSCTL